MKNAGDAMVMVASRAEFVPHVVDPECSVVKTAISAKGQAACQMQSVHDVAGTGKMDVWDTCTRCKGNKTVSSTQPCTHSQYSGHYYCKNTGNVVEQLHDD